MKHLKFVFFTIVIFAFNTLSAQPPAPSTVTATIGTPANGTAHYLNISWATSTGATSYELEASTNGTTWINIYTGAALTYSHNTGNVADAAYYYRVRASNGTFSAYTNATQFPIHTACDAPSTPQVSTVTTNSITLTLQAEAPVVNPVTTTYSIYSTTTSQYIQANGTLGATEVFQTRSAWSSVIVTGLSSNTNYCFYAKARNSDGYISIAQGGSLTTTEPFTTAANFNTTSAAPTNRYWSPASCTTGGLTYISTGGCTDGYIGKTGAWNNFFGCFLRTPAINCTGNAMAVINFDLSNSYFASQPNDRITFNMWVDGGYKQASAVKINGASVGSLISGQMGIRFDQLRNCVNVTVEYDLTTSSDLSGILFYLNPSCGYNNSNVFSVGIDNISIQGQSAPTACATTTACAAAAIQSSTGNTAVCTGASTSFTVTTTGAVASYQWQVSTNGGTNWTNATGTPYTNGNTAQLSIAGVTNTMNGYKYRCNVTGTCSGNPVSAVATLTVNGAPVTPTAVYGSPLICKDKEGVAYATDAVQGATGYQWVMPQGGTLLTGANTTSITADFTNAITGVISVAALNACGVSTPAQLNVTISAEPATPGIISGSDTLCPGVQQTYNVQPSNDATSYVWELPNGWSGTSSINSIIATAGSSGGVIMVYANNLCGNSLSPASLLVSTSGTTAQPGPISGLVNVCAGDTITYSVSAVSGANGYVWTLPNGWSGNSTSNTIAVIPSTIAGNIQVAAQGSCGTSSAQILPVDIKVRPSLPVIVGEGAVCGNTTETFTYSSVGGVNGFDVITPMDWLSTTVTGGSANITFSNISGNILVIAYNECGVSDTASKTVTVLPAPVVQFNYSGSAVCSTAAPLLLAATPAGGVYSGTAVGGGYFNPGLAPVGNNELSYSYTDGNGCTAQDTTVITTVICSGIDDMQMEVSIYPNPFNDYLNITTDNSEIQNAVLVDAIGRNIGTTTFAGSLARIDIPAGTPAGTYIVLLLNDKKHVIARQNVVLNK